MSNFDPVKLCEFIGNECIGKFSEAFCLAATVKRRLVPISFERTLPDQRFWFEYGRGLKHATPTELLKDLHSAMAGFTRIIEDRYIPAIVKTLKAAYQVMPIEIKGMASCGDYLLNHWTSQQTSLRGRTIIFSPGCFTPFLSAGKEAMKGAFSRVTEPLADSFLFQSLEEGIIAFQRDAITLTSYNILEPTTLTSTKAVKTFCFNGLALRVTCEIAERLKVRLEWTGSISQINLNHCLFVPSESFLAY